ncbi:MAG TPA: LysR family transcriptional regulator [Burkholderiaceae bacterium]
MELDELRVFATVAELASFSRAAEQLGLAKGRVSTVVQRLEARLGTRLLQRTTRRVRLTPDGERFLDRGRELLAEAEQLAAMFRPAATGLTGRLRIDLPNVIARDLVVPRLPEFLAAHPQLDIAISTTDRRVDLVHEGFDCVLRVGALGDADLVARRIGAMRMCNAASPAYLARHGTPRTLDELARHRVVHYAPALSGHDGRWEYVDPADGRTRFHPVRAAVVVNGTDAYQAAALAGLGLYQAPAKGVREHVAQGRLVEVLPGFVPAPMPVSLLYPHRRQLTPRVQAVLAWLEAVVGPSLDG